MNAIIGSAGVIILLLAYFLNLFGYIRTETKIYPMMNFIGAGLSAYASYLINYFPFVILEGTWAVVSLISLARLKLK